MKLESKVPSGDIAQKWDKHRFEMKLVNPANKRKFRVIVVGSGLAGASASATMALSPATMASVKLFGVSTDKMAIAALAPIP